MICLLATLLVLVAARVRQPPAADSIEYALAAGVVITQAEPGSEMNVPDARSREGLSAVRDQLHRFTTSGDGRYLRYASALLDAHSENGAVSIEFRLLRARVLQSQHRFSNAAEILRRLLKTEPRKTEAWLLLSDASRRAGNIVESRRACMNVALIGQTTLASWCAVQVLQSKGETQQAYQVATSLLRSIDEYPPPLRRWFLEIIAEAAVAEGRKQDAEVFYQRALALGETTMALRLAFADTLLRINKSDEVIELLRNDRGNVGALIRIVIAEQQLGEPVNLIVVSQIAKSFTGLTAASSTDVRLRDKAIYELYYKMDAKAALEYALANWQQQKGSEDYALLREAAELAHEPEIEKMLERWRSRAAHGFQS